MRVYSIVKTDKGRTKMKQPNKWNLDKYKQNLRVDNESVYSYDTRVAHINHLDKTITPLGWWSVTTSKHINYVTGEYGYTLNKT